MQCADVNNQEIKICELRFSYVRYKVINPMLCK